MQLTFYLLFSFAHKRLGEILSRRQEYSTMQLEHSVRRGTRLITGKLVGGPLKAKVVFLPSSKRSLTTRCRQDPNRLSWRPNQRKSWVPTVTIAIASTIAGAAALGAYSLLSDRGPQPPVAADPSKKTLLILGMNMDSGREADETDIGRHWLGICLSTQRP
jgi:hypothetical protein